MRGCPAVMRATRSSTTSDWVWEPTLEGQPKEAVGPLPDPGWSHCGQKGLTNQQELIDLCKWLDSQFDPVSLNAYTSREAYQDAKSDCGAAAKSSHIFM